MTELQKAMLRASEIRQRLNELGGADELTDEQSAELDRLRNEYGEVEKRQRELITAEAEAETTTTERGETPEERELRELHDAAEFGNYIAAAISHRALAGAENDLNQALGIAGDRFPLAMLVEERAAIDGDAQGNQQPWIDRLFADTAAMALGVTMPSVAPGVSAYPLLVSNAAPAQRGRTEAIAAAATISATVTEVKPSRSAVKAVYSIEDTARLPGLAEAIRRDLSASMVEKIDRTIFVGDDGANEAGADITGFTTAGVAELTLTQADKVAAEKVLAVFAGLIDGKHAASMGDLNIVATVGSNALWLSTLPTNNRNETLARILRDNDLSWTTRGEIETATADGDFGGFVGLARGIENTAVAPVWQSAQLIVDPYTEADSGEVVLTLNYLWNFAIPRVANFRRLKYVA